MIYTKYETSKPKTTKGIKVWYVTQVEKYSSLITLSILKIDL